MLTDLRLALRGFARQPGFALLAVLILTLGLGASTAIFGLLDAAVLRPLPFPEPGRLVTIHLLAREDRAAPPSPFAWSYPKFLRFRKEAGGFEAMAGYAGPTSLTFIGNDRPERLAAEEVGGSYFNVLGLAPAAGRLFETSFDDRPGEPAVVVLSHHLWRDRFAGQSGVIGTDLRLNGRSLRVIGVAPAGFRGLTGGADLFVPITLAPWFEYSDILEEAGNHWFRVVGRLAPETTFPAGAAEAARAGDVVDREYHFPQQAAPWSAGIAGLGESRVDPAFRRSVWLLAGAVGLVLLIGCVNLTSLMVARAAARRREIGVRLALGASRVRVIRQVLAETMLLSLAGWGLGLLFGAVAVRVLARALVAQTSSGSFFDPTMVQLDLRVAGFGLLLALAAALFSAILPALQASRPRLAETIKHTGPEGRGRRFGVQQALVVSEVALALVLLAGAGLLARSFLGLRQLDPGIDPDGVLTLRYAAADGDFAKRDPVAFRAAATERLAALPGVTSASIALCPPLTSRCSGSVVSRVDGRAFRVGESAVGIGLHAVTPDHFRTLGIPLLRGRTFTSFDAPGTPRVVVLNETAARRLFPGQDPIGHRMSAATFYFAGGDSTAEVIGVVKDVRYGSYQAEPEPDLYYPMSYLRAFGNAGTVFVRGAGDPARLADLVQQTPGDNPELGEELEAALNGLRDEYQAAFRLFYLQEWNCMEIGRSLGVPEGTVKTWLFRARKEIADRLKRRGVVSDDGHELHRI